MGRWGAVVAALAAAATPRAVAILNINTNALHYSVREDASSCACLNWKEVYASGAVSCGQGHEFYTEEVYGHCKGYTHEQCVANDNEFCKGQSYNGFFPHQDHNYCMKKSQDWDNKQDWCYVSSNCSDLRGGRSASEQVSWKYCDKATDVSLGSLPLQQFFEVVKRHSQINAGMLATLAYPWTRQKWEDLGAYWGFSEDVLPCDPVSECQRSMDALRASAKPHSLIWDQLFGDMHLVSGDEVWSISHEGEWRCLRSCSPGPLALMGFG